MVNTSVKQRANVVRDNEKIDLWHWRLAHVTRATRPDIAQDVSVVFRFNSESRKAHMHAVKRIFRYIGA